MQIIRNGLSLLAGGLLLTPLAIEAGQPTRVTAHGNAPDWQLEIPEQGNRIRFTLEGNVGNYRYGKLGPTLYSDKNTHVYRVLDKSHIMSVFVKSEACTDSATGKSHEVTVIVSLDGKYYFGCGDVHTQLLEP
jgi:uncharacterized membrane protein